MANSLSGFSRQQIDEAIKKTAGSNKAVAGDLRRQLFSTGNDDPSVHAETRSAARDAVLRQLQGGGGGSSTSAGVNSGAGGAGAAGSQWTYRSLNGVLSTGTIGYGGAGGGGGGITSTGFNNSIGGRGGDGANGSGGGGGGRGSTTGGGTGNGGNGGDALILFVYVESKGATFATIIGSSWSHNF